MKNIRTGYMSFVFLSGALVLANNALCVSDPTWATGSADFEIWLSAGLTWGAGTLIPLATLNSRSAGIISCAPGRIKSNTTYRVQPALKDISSGDYVAVMTDFKSSYLRILEGHSAFKLRVNPRCRVGEKDRIE